MKKLIGLSLSLILVIGITGSATYANFAEDETSLGNLMEAGTLDLKTDDADGVSQTLYDLTMEPDTTVSSTIVLGNVGTTDGATLDIVFSYEKSDGSPNTVIMAADNVSTKMEVTALDYGSANLLLPGGIVDVNGNGYKDVYDLVHSDFTGLSGIAAAGTKNFIISVRLRSDTGSGYQADGIVITMQFTLKQ